MKRLLVITILFLPALLLVQCSKKETAATVSNEQENIKSTNAQFTADSSLTFVELGSVSCVPCKAMQPIIKSIEKKYNGKVKVISYDVWTAEGEIYGRKYEISAIPTQVFLDEKGNEFYRHVGFFPEDQIDKVIQSRGIKQ